MRPIIAAGAGTSCCPPDSIRSPILRAERRRRGRSTDPTDLLQLLTSPRPPAAAAELVDTALSQSQKVRLPAASGTCGRWVDKLRRSTDLRGVGGAPEPGWTGRLLRGPARRL